MVVFHLTARGATAAGRADRSAEAAEPAYYTGPTTTGPDVIVGGIGTVKRFDRDPATGITAYSITTTACNIGDDWVNWFRFTDQHPLIAQNMYRLKEGRFEQIGMSWVKHGFSPGVGVICSPQCFGDPQGEHLGVGCSDTYNTMTNGFQNNLGPRYDTNATTGGFVFPFTAPTLDESDTIARRLQVHDADLEPAENANALYFLEAQYISPDDAAAGNQDNNASHVRITIAEGIGPNPPVYKVLLAGQTQRERPAIFAWQDNDPNVDIELVDVPGDRRFLVGYRVIKQDTGLWRYEYAVLNLNSFRSCGSLSVPIPAGVSVANVGFHDIDAHSSPVLDTTDWAATVEAGELIWSTEAFTVDPNANALRWGTLYNFRFDADACPSDGAITLGLFRPRRVCVGGLADGLDCPVNADCGDGGSCMDDADPPFVNIPAKVPSGTLRSATTNPADGAVDARQPSEPNGSNPDGWMAFTFAFSASSSGLTVADFTVNQEGGQLQAPGVTDIEHLGSRTVRVNLGDRIAETAWTTVAQASGGCTRIGYLPGNVRGDGVNELAAAAVLIDCLNNSAECTDWQADINRDGSRATVLDLTRLSDLFNGAGVYRSYTNLTLP